MMMMKLFVLSALLIVGLYGISITTTTCSSSTDCSGTCSSATVDNVPSTCQSLDPVGSSKITCDNDIYQQLGWSTSTDCSGAPYLNYTSPSGTCYSTGVSSFKWTCTDGAAGIKLFIAITAAFIASLFQ